MSTHLHESAGDSLGFHAPQPSDSVFGSGSGSIASQLVELMVAAWRRGERPTAEDFLASHPELGTEGALRLIFEEVCLRQEAGMEIVAAEVVSRFPQWRAELEVLLDCHRMMQPQRAPAAFPEVSESLGGFRLLAELGRGASGRIFLGAQHALADRPMVLKVTTCGQEEHLSLARLQHMNIVPLYSEQVLPARNLRILCMPFLGGATLAQILHSLRDCPPSARTGKHLIEALDQIQAQAGLPVSLPAQGPFRGTLNRSSYVQAIVWIGACLADGLQYAHDRGLVHMDIKPSNVLLTSDGQPMLLDFHLARGPIDRDGPLPPRLGGTPAYASPEQRAAMASIRQRRAIRVPVDGRADLYSLGVLLYEALGGSRPARGKAVARLPLHELNPQVSLGLSDLIHKCLLPDPRDRYPDAASLAGDLRRHLNHLPLVGVPNRSPIERWRKWRRRRPSALPRQLVLLGSALAALTAVALLSTVYRQRLDGFETRLSASRAARRAERFGAAEVELRQGLELAVPTFAFGTWRQTFDEELGLVQRDRKATELHRLAELVRFRAGLAPKPSDEDSALIHRGRELWLARNLLLNPMAGHRESELEQRIRTDLLDLMTVWADLRVRLAPAGEADAARREALQRLDEAVAALGPSPSLQRLRKSYSETLGRPGAAAISVPEPQTAWEHCDLGRSYLRAGDPARAAAEFERAVDLRPQDLWPNFYQGLCAYQLRRFEAAVRAFSVCIALAHDTPECYFNRALAHEALGQTSEAVRDYTRALRCDRKLTDAALNRGILYYSAGRYTDAAADLDQALALGAGRETRGVIHYNRALVDLARGDRPAARSDLEAAMGYGHTEARTLHERLP